MSHPETEAPGWTPPRATLLAWLTYTLTTLLLTWPLLTGQFLVGRTSDQYSAGYAFREFGARFFREHGRIPEWNPYLFGGMPFIGAMHGDIFYPTAWLRWIFPVDVGMTLGFALHFVLAGGFGYALLRRLGTGWIGALVGGLAYQLSGILASLVQPGHDGKLFVSALAPLALLALLAAVRERRAWGYPLFALLVGLALISPHYQMTYYLLVAAGFWTLWLAVLDPAGPRGKGAPAAIGLAFAAVVLGLALSALQALPFLRYLPFAARGTDQGWEYATSYSLPLAELLTTVLPQFTGVLGSYWGSNPIKLHTEYLGGVVVLLAFLGLTDARRGPVRWALLGLAGFFLLVALGGHTPFYRLWYEVMPLMKKVRAPGMAFFLVALPVSLFAGFGADRLVQGRVPPARVLVAGGLLALLGLLGAIGALQPVAEAIALPERMERAITNAAELRLGGIRLLLAMLLGTGAAWAIAAGRLRGPAAAGALALAAAGDLWSIDRQFFTWSPPARDLYASDQLVDAMRAVPAPTRVLDVFPGQVYEHSILMSHQLPQVFGYHGNELRFYDELWGGKNVFQHTGNPNLWELWAVRFLVLPSEQPIEGLRQVAGPVRTSIGSTGYLYERDTPPPYARVVGAAAKVDEAQIVPTLLDRRFPLDMVALYPDTASVAPAPIPNGQLPEPTPVRAAVTAWEPGRMTIALEGQDSRPTYLLVAENWYPDWRASVDGSPAPVLRGNFAQLSVVLPPGARQVELRFRSEQYALGKLVSGVALLGILGWLALAWRADRGAARG